MATSQAVGLFAVPTTPKPSLSQGSWSTVRMWNFGAANASSFDCRATTANSDSRQRCDASPIRGGLAAADLLFGPGQFLNRRACHGGQSAQRGVSLARAKHQFLRNATALFVIAAVRENTAGLLQNNIHIGGGAFIQLAHPW